MSKISIIIPVYNGDKVLFTNTVKSCLNQTYKDIEILIIDNGKNSDIEEIISQFNQNDKIRVFKNKNHTAASGRNIGIRNAIGDWLLFLDADDYLSNETCETMIEKAIFYNSDCVICNYIREYHDHSEKVYCFQDDKIYLSRIDYIKDILTVQKGVGFCWGKLIKRTAVSDIFLNENLELAEDAEYCIRLSQNLKNIVGIKKFLFHYIFNPNSIVRSFDNEYANKYLLSMNIIYSDLNTEFKSNPAIIKYYYNFVIYHVLLILVNYCANPKNKNKMKSLKFVLQNDVVEKSIKYSSYEDLSFTRKVPLFLLKHKMNYLALFVGKIRQYQFKRFSH
ncbi:glycosyltransferase family 2 protein [Catenisphaera adipataccumulans]|uniref:Glycosyltransferase involved in cell wall biosynthesis n=1 Tax=Catenisphaera adipataccumulans TaxID=700500 RepID=A0A7W8D1B9_9FIRM|nr:glycosyltransferase family 2 protein [Catenisphaera adipataccumulans]MBB5183740.1 glycosyltransferase involved in cell wall biosynthesis [Catenisphaera adipataccumulans]